MFEARDVISHDRIAQVYPISYKLKKMLKKVFDSS